ncbi:MAG: DinB family protein [Flavobacterium sp.]|nr:DinB family protein [Flavobacterium sp.]
MNKSELITNLNTTHFAFWDTAIHLPNPTISINGKWSVAQNVEHINIALGRVNNYLSLPKTSIESNFGFSNRESISNEALIEKYLNALANGTKATAPFIPELNINSNIQELVHQGKNNLESFISNLQNWSEEELDKYNCPHPALGKITVREMLYFTIYHVQHHNKIIQK